MLVAPPRGPHPSVRLVWFWRGLGFTFLFAPFLGWPLVLPIGYALTVLGVDTVPAYILGWIALIFTAIVGVMIGTRRRFDRTSYDLGGDVLRVRTGVLFPIVATIPLERVDGFVIRSGPLQRRYGISTVLIRTGPTTEGRPWHEATLWGVVDAPAVVASLDERRRALRAPKPAPSPISPPVSRARPTTPR